MRPLLLRPWLAISVVSLTLALGCNHGRRSCHCQSGSLRLSPVLVVSDKDPKGLTADTGQNLRVQTSVATIPYPATGTRPEWLPQVNPSAGRDVVQADPVLQPPEVAKGTVSQAGSMEGVAADKGIQRAAYPRRGKEGPVQPRTLGDLMAPPRFGHAPDYSWLTGELHYLHVRNIWQVRYAPVDEEDRYGGSLTLAGGGPMTGFRSGQTVRVEGQLDPDSREASPLYRVRSLQLLDRP